MPNRIKVVDGKFITSGDGKEFTPRGIQLIFNNLEEAGAQLNDCAAHGVNTVRVFMGSSDPSYIEGFLLAAKTRGIFVILELSNFDMDNFPLVESDGTPHPKVSVHNARHIDMAYIRRNARLVRETLRKITEDAREAIFSVELRNEAAVALHVEPFNLSETIDNIGFVGKTYDMTSPDDRLALMDDGIHNATNNLVGAIHSVDPEILVAWSTYVLQNGRTSFRDNITRGEELFPFRAAKLAGHPSLAYVDIHVYAKNGVGDIEELLTNERIEWDEVQQERALTRKPIIAGEYGVYRKPEWGPLEQAGLAEGGRLAAAIINHYLPGRGFAGGIFWNYNNSMDTYTAREGNKEIMKALTPQSYVKPIGDFSVVTGIGDNGNPIKTLFYSDGYYAYPLRHPALHELHKKWHRNTYPHQPRTWLGDRDLSEFGPVEEWPIGYFSFHPDDHPDASISSPPAGQTTCFSLAGTNHSPSGGKCLVFPAPELVEKHKLDNPREISWWGYLPYVNGLFPDKKLWTGATLSPVTFSILRAIPTEESVKLDTGVAENIKPEEAELLKEDTPSGISPAKT